jgi:hypothetical protein
MDSNAAQGSESSLLAVAPLCMLWSTAFRRMSMLPLSAEFMLGPAFLCFLPDCTREDIDSLYCFQAISKFCVLLKSSSATSSKGPRSFSPRTPLISLAERMKTLVLSKNASTNSQRIIGLLYFPSLCARWGAASSSPSCAPPRPGFTALYDG